ncbi:MAG: C2H2-type zinc finger protein [Promethearchaeota archaeon]
MSRFVFNIKGKCIATLYATKNMFGKDVEANMNYFLEPGSSQIVVDQDVLSFKGKDIKAGYIQADVRTDDVRAFFINIQKIRILPLILGIISIIIGIITLVMSIIFFLFIIIGIVLLIAGIVLIIKALIRSVKFVIRVTSHLFNFLTITQSTMHFTSQFQDFIKAFWVVVKGQGNQGQYSLKEVNHQDISPSNGTEWATLPNTAQGETLTFKDVSINNPVGSIQDESIGASTTVTYTCNVCGERFSDQDALLAHKRDMAHW